MAIRSIPIRDRSVRFRIKELKNSSITFAVSDINYGSSLTINCTITEGTTGNVELTIGNEYYESKTITTPGSISFTVTGLTTGSKTVVARYLGDSNYKASIYTDTFSVTKPTVSSFPIRYMQKTYPNDYETMTSVPQATIDYLNSIRPDRIVSLLDGCKALTTIDLTNLDTSEVTNMRYVFYQCNALTSLDLSTWDTSKVTFMENLFYYCTNLRVLDLTGWDTSSVVASDAMEMMFTKCDNLQYLILGDATKIFNMIDASCGRLNTTCKILVPQSVLGTYISATNWSTIASQFEAIENYVITRSNGGVTVTAN